LNVLFSSRQIFGGQSGSSTDSQLRKDVVYLEGQVPNKDLPAFIIVDCPNYVGPAFFPEDEKKTWVPLVPSTFHDDTYSESRKGYAVRLVYAMTIHKSQGESLEMIVADIGIH
jgi:hypothetical protein